MSVQIGDGTVEQQHQCRSPATHHARTVRRDGVPPRHRFFFACAGAAHASSCCGCPTLQRARRSKCVMLCFTQARAVVSNDTAAVSDHQPVPGTQARRIRYTRPARAYRRLGGMCTCSTGVRRVIYNVRGTISWWSCACAMYRPPIYAARPRIVALNKRAAAVSSACALLWDYGAHFHTNSSSSQAIQTCGQPLGLRACTRYPLGRAPTAMPW